MPANWWRYPARGKGLNRYWDGTLRLRQAGLVVELRHALEGDIAVRRVGYVKVWQTLLSYTLALVGAVFLATGPSDQPTCYCLRAIQVCLRLSDALVVARHWSSDSSWLHQHDY